MFVFWLKNMIVNVHKNHFDEPGGSNENMKNIINYHFINPFVDPCNIALHYKGNFT